MNGTSQVPRRSILGLCPALRPRPNRRSLASLTVSSMLPPRFPRQGLQRLMNFGALSGGFGTCCLRFKTGVATTPARLASGWLARLYREGVEPSGSLQKVSDRSLILLFWIYPGAREVSWRPQAVPRGQRIMPSRPPQRLCAPPVAPAARTLIELDSRSARPASSPRRGEAARMSFDGACLRSANGPRSLRVERR